ncbi:M1 family metallopeptidase [Salinisphaera sp. SPP-AMP-43]|uniref:M1 family metallopeptidase n=1 Tax=Salinisphaera sp. SPP-AMP-43 TaxID=3121288 RepID=UPI003C6E0EA0
MTKRPNRFLALTLALSALAGSAAAADSQAPTGKLPRWAVPQSYDIALKADPAAARFSGQARIQVALDKSSRVIWLNARKLKVGHAEVIEADGTAHTAAFRIVDPKAGVAKLTLEQPLEPQTVTLAFAYTAPLNTHLRGFYKVDYQDRAYAMTQMEATSARLAFPSFDEPGFKTPFTLHLTVPDDDQAVANTPVAKRTDLDNGWQRLDFEPTPPLPSYLVAFAVGPWDIVDGPSLPKNQWRDHSTPVRGIAAHGRGSELQPALDQTPGIMTALEAYYDYGYPFDKIDVLAAPDFAAGAMENVGLVTFRDWYMLLSPDSPASSRRGSFEVEAHELAHQWTGDTVTMAWWDDLWLNESFATWMQQKITHQLHPEYHAELDRITGAEGAMGEDALTTARRIRQPIDGFGDIGNAFDGITYQKGASVLGMFEAFVGDDTFRTGMRDYIRAHEFGTATADDLVDAIAQAADRGDDFRAAFHSFLDQSGVPYVTTEIARDDGQTVLDVAQQRFLPIGSAGDPERSWGLPLCVRYPLAAGGSRTRCQLIDAARGRIALPGAAEQPDWIMPNAGADGYYRFALDRSQFAALESHLDQLTDAEKIAFADSVWAAFEQDRLHAPALLATMQGLADEATPAVALAPIGGIRWLWEHKAATEAQRDRLREAARSAYLPRLENLGYQRREGESADAAELRQRLATFLGVQLGLKPVADALAAQGQAVLAPALAGNDSANAGLDFSQADPDLLADALTVAVRRQGKPVVQALFDALGRNGDADQRNAMIAALARVQDPELKTEVRNYALTDRIKVGEMMAMLGNGGRHSASQRSPDSVATMWPWFTAHFKAIRDRVGAMSGGSLPPLAAAGACSDKAADRLEDFFEPKVDQLPGAQRNLAQTAESIRLCAALVQHQSFDTQASPKQAAREASADRPGSAASWGVSS